MRSPPVGILMEAAGMKYLVDTLIALSGRLKSIRG
jgi:hypothetical protein